MKKRRNPNYNTLTGRHYNRSTIISNYLQKSYNPHPQLVQTSPLNREARAPRRCYATACMWAGKNCRGMYYNTAEKNKLKTNAKTSTRAQRSSPWSSGDSRLTGRTRPMIGTHREEEAEGEVEDGVVEHVQLPDPAPTIPTF